MTWNGSSFYQMHLPFLYLIATVLRGVYVTAVFYMSKPEGDLVMRTVHFNTFTFRSPCSSPISQTLCKCWILVLIYYSESRKAFKLLQNRLLLSFFPYPLLFLLINGTENYTRIPVVIIIDLVLMCYDFDCCLKAPDNYQARRKHLIRKAIHIFFFKMRTFQLAVITHRLLSSLSIQKCPIYLFYKRCSGVVEGIYSTASRAQYMPRGGN